MDLFYPHICTIVCFSYMLQISQSINRFHYRVHHRLQHVSSSKFWPINAIVQFSKTKTTQDDVWPLFPAIIRKLKHSSSSGLANLILTYFVRFNCALFHSFHSRVDFCSKENVFLRFDSLTRLKCHAECIIRWLPLYQEHRCRYCSTNGRICCYPNKKISPRKPSERGRIEKFVRHSSF